MNRFSYVRAGDVAEAVREVAADPAAKIIAGGTNLVDLMKYNVERPPRLVDIGRLPGLDAIEDTATQLVVVRLSGVSTSCSVRW